MKSCTEHTLLVEYTLENANLYYISNSKKYLIVSVPIEDTFTFHSILKLIILGKI